ncbi:MAG: hypothetical protein GY898_21350 [Proteobacteria bacterium]|nr:hypothetical protein [Pseudomonadota bacterium]
MRAPVLLLLPVLAACPPVLEPREPTPEPPPEYVYTGEISNLDGAMPDVRVWVAGEQTATDSEGAYRSVSSVYPAQVDLEQWTNNVRSLLDCSLEHSRWLPGGTFTINPSVDGTLFLPGVGVDDELSFDVRTVTETDVLTSFAPAAPEGPFAVDGGVEFTFRGTRGGTVLAVAMTVSDDVPIAASWSVHDGLDDGDRITLTRIEPAGFITIGEPSEPPTTGPEWRQEV